MAIDKNLAKTRNIGISAHIDSGKTTLSERILFYCDKIHKIEDVKGGGAGATMDHMELEKEKGITITSAATTVEWPGLGEKGITFAEGDQKNIKVNLIDTPGHVDFTVEVERSLRVLDGAILVLCSVAGVQSQSITVDRQMKRYRVPRLAFLNKMDRMGANPYNGVKALREKLGHNAVLMQIPIGAEENFKGCVDLIAMKAYYFDGENGEIVREEAIPGELQDQAAKAREEMLDTISAFDDQMMEDIIEGREISEEAIHRAVRTGVNTLKFTPVFMGSAFKNKGVQLLLNAVARYLPSPVSAEKPKAIDSNTNQKVNLEPDQDMPLVCMAFKITDEQFGQLTYTRIYQGKLTKGDTLFNTRTKKRVRVGRIVRMNANDRENIDWAGAGDIIAMIGVDCASGDTFVADDGKVEHLSCEGMHVPIPVIELSIKAKDKEMQARMSKGLQRFIKEDPTFHLFTDEESGETRIAGMGELHLEIYVERLKREYKAEVEIGAPQVNYRETIRGEAKLDYTHKKQTGGSGQFAKIQIAIEPMDTSSGELYEFENKVTGGRVPREYIPSVDAGIQDALNDGVLAGYPVVGIKATLIDGASHDVDSSEMAFKIAGRMAFKEAARKANPVLLEPLMDVEVRTPEEYMGDVIGDLNARRGQMQSMEDAAGVKVIRAHVPLSGMFGYIGDLRSKTQGRAVYSMTFNSYAEVPKAVADEIIQKTRGE